MSVIRKNWKLLLLSLFFICLFTRLGVWQLNRAHEKEALLKTYEARQKAEPLDVNQILKLKEARFYRLTLHGRFDNQHTFLLDNKIFAGKVGYEVYVPFYADGLNSPILVDRGFITLGQNRAQLPFIAGIENATTVVGLLNLPPAYLALGQMQESLQTKWPLRIEYVNLSTINTLLRQNFYPYVLMLAPNHPAAFAMEWQIVTMGPERHRGYALQWFAFALTLLILSVALSLRGMRT